MTRPPRVPWRWPVPARLVSGLSAIMIICAFSLLVSQPVSAAVQNLYTSPYNLWTGQTTAPLVHSDPAASVASFTRDAVENGTLGGCGNYPSDTSVNTYSVWYTFTPPTGGGSPELLRLIREQWGLTHQIDQQIGGLLP